MKRKLKILWRQRRNGEKEKVKKKQKKTKTRKVCFCNSFHRKSIFSFPLKHTHTHICRLLAGGIAKGHLFSRAANVSVNRPWTLKRSCHRIWPTFKCNKLFQNGSRRLYKNTSKISIKNKIANYGEKSCKRSHDWLNSHFKRIFFQLRLVNLYVYLRIWILII